jgi:hypothetical protein
MTVVVDPPGSDETSCFIDRSEEVLVVLLHRLDEVMDIQKQYADNIVHINESHTIRSVGAA